MSKIDMLLSGKPSTVPLNGLSIMFRTILLDLNLTPVKFDKLVASYMVKKSFAHTRPQEYEDNEKLLRKSLRARNMSWVTFAICLDFLQIDPDRIGMELNHYSGLKTKHFVNIRNELKKCNILKIKIEK